MEQRTIVMITAAVLLVLALFISGVSILAPDVVSTDNRTNDTLLAKVWVWNTEPTIYNVVINPSPVDLNPGNTTTVNCTAFAWDYNGWQDINISNATFFHRDISNHIDTDDNNYHYSTTNCSCAQQGSSSTNASCSCFFEVEYYAYNGTWICNVTVNDEGGNATERIYKFNASRNASVYVNTVIGIDVPAEIDYGNLSVTELSELKAANVTNWGNVPINVSVRGYGGTDEYLPGAGNFSMLCEYGNITHGWQRYTFNNETSYAFMINLSNTSTLVQNLTLPIRTNDIDYGNDTNVTYWRIQIPLSVGGFCNGTIQFSASDAR